MKLSNKLILASNSPRRKELMKAIGLSFEVNTVGFDEVFPDDLPAEKVAKYLAVEKNKAHRGAFADELIVTADTIVIFSGKVLGKPKDRVEAKETLKLLSGKIHQVITGVCISSPEKRKAFHSITDVKFHDLTLEEIEHYVTQQAPLDKAGSYGIQDWIGMIGVEWIKGSYYNVVGLPVDQVYEVLKNEF